MGRSSTLPLPPHPLSASPAANYRSAPLFHNIFPSLPSPLPHWQRPATLAQFFSQLGGWVGIAINRFTRTD